MAVSYADIMTSTEVLLRSMRTGDQTLLVLCTGQNLIDA